VCWPNERGIVKRSLCGLFVGAMNGEGFTRTAQIAVGTEGAGISICSGVDLDAAKWQVLRSVTLPP
jgi:hypothetical protein